MKIIDLLVKIANGKELPKKIKYQNYIYEYQHRRDTESSFNYMCNENGEYLSRRYFIDNILNDEIEIIEEPKKIEKITWKEKESLGKSDLTQKQKLEIVARRTEKLKKSLNQLIDVVNKLNGGNDEKV